MSYNVAFEDEASEGLLRLPPVIASKVLDQIDMLAADPAALSRPSYFPYLPIGQIYQFWCEDVEHRFWISIFFQYSTDESSIIVLAITGQEVPRRDEPEEA
jgi:hypothetical protein